MSDSELDSNRLEYAVGLETVVAKDPHVTGGKGANLARLIDAGFTVPLGFCVTTTAYRTLVSDPDTRREIESLETLEPTDTDTISELSASVRTRITNAEFPHPIKQTIDESITTLNADSYSVRSSATAEDLPTASFAGQHETFLGVTGLDTVLNRIGECMASLFTERAVAYRLKNDIPHADVAMAVVVQVMVNPVAAGVLFTADPVSGNRNIASVEANFGLGDTVVVGEVSPDNARVDRKSGEGLEYNTGRKTHALRIGTDDS